MKMQWSNRNEIHQEAGIDLFRYIAAIFIIMIHTSPLESFHEIADFVLTREIARVAVPFFLMVSGYYVVSSCFEQEFALRKIIGLEKKLGILYLISTIIYLPIRIYSGYFSDGVQVGIILRDVFFDGTFYHLWYLPATMLGIALIYLLSRKYSKTTVLVVSLVLYGIGLLGDSYYGAIEKTFVGSVYEAMFHVSSYTRNGFFFAPVFLMLGAMLYHQDHQTSEQKERKKSYVIPGFVLSMAVMILEGLILHLLNVQRHDSMYLMLIPVMYFGYQLLLMIPVSAKQMNRKIPMLIYLVHPLMIVVIRMAAKVTKLQSLLVENSLVFFLLVAFMSVLAAVVWNQILTVHRNEKKKLTPLKPKRAWIEVNMEHLTSNIHQIQSILKPKTEIMGVVKANAYGHGDLLVSKHLNELGIKAFAVATLQEGVRLRSHGIQGMILILGYTPASQANLLAKYHLTQTVFDSEYAKELDAYGKRISVHIKVDTGMHRLGEDSHAIHRFKEIFERKNLSVDGMFTHLCSADSLKEEDVAFTRKQIELFYAVTNRLKQLGYDTGKLHIQSSYGLLNYPDLECDYVRMGIAMYGVMSSKKDKTVVQLPLKPVLSVKSCIVMTKVVKQGESVGYGRQYIAEKDMRIAVVAIGYADGITRRLSCGTGQVLVRGKKADIIGRICMDQMMLDITQIPEAQAEDEVSIIGTDGSEQILVEDVADSANTITNEVLSRLGSRLPRIAVN